MNSAPLSVTLTTMTTHSDHITQPHTLRNCNNLPMPVLFPVRPPSVKTPVVRLPRSPWRRKCPGKRKWVRVRGRGTVGWMEDWNWVGQPLGVTHSPVPGKYTRIFSFYPNNITIKVYRNRDLSFQSIYSRNLQPDSVRAMRLQRGQIMKRVTNSTLGPIHGMLNMAALIFGVILRFSLLGNINHQTMT